MQHTKLYMFLRNVINFCGKCTKGLIELTRVVANKIETPVAAVLGFFYTSQNYYAAKTGFFLDFFCKRVVHFLHKEFTVWFSLFFVDKFFIAKWTKQFFVNTTTLNSFLPRLNALGSSKFISFFAFFVLCALSMSFIIFSFYA